VTSIPSKAPRVTEFWHKDARGFHSPHHLVGKTFLHVKTATLYVVVDVVFNASTDQWALRYEAHNTGRRAPFRFTRDATEFMDGRFLEVK